MRRSSLFGISFFLVTFFLLPLSVFAQVKITEIAWMGTTVSANAEWMELYNDGASPVVLDGWSLEALDGQPKIALKGSIPAQGYFLLERTNDDTVPGIAADQIYTGSLGNTGEILVLKDTSGNQVFEVDGGDNWKIGGSVVIGDNVTKQTAQLSGGVWVTAVGTPKAAAPSVVSTPTPTPTPSATPSPTPTPVVLADDTSATGTSTATSTVAAATPSPTPVPFTVYGYISAQSSQSSLSNDVQEDPFTVSAGRERITTPGSPLSFSAKVLKKSSDGSNPVFSWVFGDGASETNQNVSHTYLYPGDYFVLLNAKAGDSEAVSRTHVAVVEPGLSITSATADAVKIKNPSSYEVNLSAWKLSDGKQVFSFPTDTILPVKTETAFPSANTKLAIIPGNSVLLSNPSGKVVATFSSPAVSGTQGQGTSTFVFTSGNDIATMFATLSQATEELHGMQKELALQNTPNVGTVEVADAEYSQISPVAELADAPATSSPDMASQQTASMVAGSVIVPKPKGAFDFLKALFSW